MRDNHDYDFLAANPQVLAPRTAPVLPQGPQRRSNRSSTERDVMGPHSVRERLAVLLLTRAALGDRFGHKRMFIAGIALFTIWSEGAPRSGRCSGWCGQWSGSATCDGLRDDELAQRAACVRRRARGRLLPSACATTCGFWPSRETIPPDLVEEVLSAVGLSDIDDRRAKGCSMGMRQRLASAAALLGAGDLWRCRDDCCASISATDPRGTR